MRFSNSSVLFLAGTILLAYGSCSADREDAREELRGRGIESTQGSFNEAVIAGDTEVVDLLLDSRVKPRRGLRLAAKEGQCDVLAQLLDVGYRVDGILAAEALAWARFNGHDACVELLENAGADLNAPNREGETALTKAARQGNIPYLKVLIDVGVDPDEPDRNGQTALIRAVEGRQRKSIRELVRSGAEVNATDVDGWTPLAYAARNGRNRIVRMLIGLGADVNHPTKTGWTPAALAALEGHRRVLRTLLRVGADPNAASEAGLTPLMRAAQRGDGRMARLLLQRGADRELRIDGVDAAWWAETTGHPALARLLSESSFAGANRS